MSFSYRCGVVQWCSPLNLLLHCQMMQRYLSVECHTFEPYTEPQSPQKIMEENKKYKAMVEEELANRGLLKKFKDAVVAAFHG